MKEAALYHTAYVARCIARIAVARAVAVHCGLREQGGGYTGATDLFSLRRQYR